MARKVTRRQLLLQIDRLHPAIANAFYAAFADVRRQAQVTRIAELIASGRLDMVSDELGLDSPRFAQLTEEIRTVYASGGKQGATEIPMLKGTGGARVKLNFDMRNPRAEAWIRNESSRLVTDLVADQRNSIRIAVSEGTMIGNNPRMTALDIIGRVGPSGRRSGGIVGLTSQQTKFVFNARSELMSGDPMQMARYLGRGRRDKRFDSIVQTAIDSKKSIGIADVDKITGRYSDRMLQLRGENIARTEALTAFSAAREESFLQAVDTGLVRAGNVLKIWSSTGDDRTREAHMELNGAEVAIDQPFDSPTGAQLMFPGDTSLGAGGEDLINCRCTVEYRIDMIAETLQ